MFLLLSLYYLSLAFRLHLLSESVRALLCPVVKVHPLLKLGIFWNVLGSSSERLVHFWVEVNDAARTLGGRDFPLQVPLLVQNHLWLLWQSQRVYCSEYVSLVQVVTGL